MGAHVHSIFRISPDDQRNLYVFVFAIPPWTDAYDWIEAKFVKLSSALGAEGLLVMSDQDTLGSELAAAYSRIDEQIRKLPIHKSGLIVANVNPHRARMEPTAEGRVLLLPIDTSSRSQVSKVVGKVIEAARTGDLSKLESLAEPLDGNTKHGVLQALKDSVLFEPNFAGVGIDLKTLGAKLHDRKRQRRER